MSVTKLDRKYLFSGLVLLLCWLIFQGLALADYAYYYPRFAVSDSRGELVGLALTNNGGATAAVDIVINDQDGVIRQVENWSIPARGQKSAVIGAELGELEGSFQVISDQPLTGLCFLFADHMTVMYDVPGSQQVKNQLQLPHLALSEFWSMHLMFSNPGTAPVQVTIVYRDAAGQAAGSGLQVDLKAGGSADLDLASLVLEGGAALEGSLELTVDQGGIVAFATYDGLQENSVFRAGLNLTDPTAAADNYTPVTESQYAVVTCSAPDFGSGAHALVEVARPRAVQQNLLPTISDIKAVARGEYFYRLERFFGDSVTKFAATAPATPIWQYSTMDEGDGASSNPKSMTFVSDGKAYIPRYETNKLWVVNPEAASQEDFKTGEVDLSVYADSDGVPEMSHGVVVNGKYFLLLERLDQDNGFVPSNTAYVAVIDTASDQEIDTGSGSPDDFYGIALPIKNPLSIVYNQAAGKIFVQGVGRYESSWSGTPAEYSGGIVAIDPNTYSVSMVVDDGDDASHPYGNIAGLAVVSATRGYFVSYAGWGDNALYGFNPTTGAVDAAPLVAFSGGDNIAALAVDNSGFLWVGTGATSGGRLTIINPADDSIDQVQNLTLNPQGITFGTWE